MKSAPIVEAYEDIKRFLNLHQTYNKAIIERKCFIHLQLDSAKCWCRKAGPDGCDLPCPPKPSGV